MGWEDRPYYRDRSSEPMSPLQWLMTGSVPLFTAFGIRVRAHAALLVLAVLILLFGVGSGGMGPRVQFVTALFGIVLLHEFGHCFAARWMGGQADEILMTPLGGLAMAYAPRRPWPQFVTVAGGPLVNVLICLICGAGLFAIIGYWPLGPFQFGSVHERVVDSRLLNWAGFLFWIYGISYALLIFNLLPVFPLDGGQLLQSILWPKLGYYKSMLITVNIGMVGGVLMMMIGLASLGYWFGGLLLVAIGLTCLMNSLNTRRMLIAEGPWAFSDEDMGGYGAPAITRNPQSDFRARRAAKRREKLQRQAEIEQQRIDQILAKVSASGMASLNWMERRALRKATERQRSRDAELKRLRRS